MFKDYVKRFTKQDLIASMLMVAFIVLMVLFCKYFVFSDDVEIGQLTMEVVIVDEESRINNSIGQSFDYKGSFKLHRNTSSSIKANNKQISVVARNSLFYTKRQFMLSEENVALE